MSNASSPYRPHDPGHDYYEPGVYLITVVVSGREPLLSCLNQDVKAPGVVLKPLGQEVMRCWDMIPAIQEKNGRKVRVHAAVCMPEHFHGVLEVVERMNVSVGEVVRGFKVGCTKAWQKEALAKDGKGAQPNVVATSTGQPHLVDRKRLQHMSHKQREAYYASVGREYRPLFDDNYDDTVCLDERHKAAMIHYVEDNPRRAIYRKLKPDCMRRVLHLRIASRDKEGAEVVRDYAAFGNLFLLRWSRKVQVFCHRMVPGTRVPYASTQAYKDECAEWKRKIMQGATVIVTPGISEGERLIKTSCIEHGYPLIHIQKEPITPYWKPEQSRFDACVNGALLILAPWNAEALGDFNHVESSADYSIFHNLNDIAAEICRFDGKAWIVE